MRNLPQAVATHLAFGAGVDVRVLVWITARDRATAEPVPFGFWTGADHQEIEVDGAARLYHGLGALLDMDPVTSSATAQEKIWSLRVSPLHPQIAEVIRTYDARLAPVEVHEWHFDPVTHLPLAPPIRAIRGTVMEVDIPVPAEGEDISATISVVTDAWRLTQGLTLTRSHEALLARTAGADQFRRYNVVTGVRVYWGEAAPAVPGGAGGGPGLGDTNGAGWVS